jgi:sialic acid synthase SpsE
MVIEKKMRTRHFLVGEGQPVYYIADIAANHGGDLGLAKELIMAAAESGASAAKFQNFTAQSLVSAKGFESLVTVGAHQSKWKDSVFDSYDAATLNLDWTQELMETAHKAGIDYFTSAYSKELLDATLPYIDAIKVGSGDITYHQLIESARRSGKPFFIATGASYSYEVDLAVECISAQDDIFCLMQCNTDYTAESFDDVSIVQSRYNNINLKCLDTFAQKYPNVILGLSDHTHGHLTVLGAVGLYNCAVVEKHFTFDNSIEGQDHSFSMTPKSWRKMVDEADLLRLELENVQDYEKRFSLTAQACGDSDALRSAIGDGLKKVMDNEKDTRIVQRRSICTSRDLEKGHILKETDFDYLRPFPANSFSPYQNKELHGKKLNTSLSKGSPLLSNHIDFGV